MISVYFNSTGYYIEGEGIEIIRSFSPSVDGSGKPVIEPLQHLYVVLACALKELKGQASAEDIVVYNDSRLIEDMSNETSPIDHVCIEMKSIIRRKLLPEFKGIVFFRKKTADSITRKLNHGQQTMLQPTDRRHLLEIAETMAAEVQEAAKTKQVGKVLHFKQQSKPLWGRKKS